MNDIIRMLIIEDTKSDLELIQHLISESQIKHTITHAETISEASMHLSSPENFDVILLDLNLPDSHGLNTIVKVASITRSLPIIVLTSEENDELSYTAIQSGAQDYLVKGKIDKHVLKKTIYYSRYRFQIINKINLDAEENKAYLATHDTLTGLPTDQVFIEQLQNCTAKCEMIKRTFGLILLKLHELDEITRSISVIAKDSIIKSIAKNLKLTQDNKASLFRFNQDMFSIILNDIDNMDSLITFINSLQHRLNFKISLENRVYSPLYSIGSAIYPFDGKNAQAILTSAFVSQKRAEKSGFNNFEIYNKNQDIKSAPLILHSDILNALERSEFFLHYQPQLDLRKDKLLGFEALIRWHHPKLGMVQPDIFIPIAEEHKLITPLGEWVIDHTCNTIAKWNAKFLNDIFISIDVNVSIQQLEFSNLYTFIESIIEKYHIKPQTLGIELTESIFLSDPEQIINKLNSFRDLGIKIALDDFGKGYSSLSYLNHLPLDYLKLDVGFIKGITQSKEKKSIVKSVIQLSHDLNFKVIAEGVETKEQLDWLKENDCDAIQGYYYSKPKSENEIEEMLAANTNQPE